MCSDPKRDSHRFADLVREHLQREGSEPPARFVKWEKQVRKRRAPADPLAPRKRGKENRAGGQDDASLVALIRWVERGTVWDLRSFELYASDVTTDGLGCHINFCLLSVPCTAYTLKIPKPSHQQEQATARRGQLPGLVGRQVWREPRGRRP